MLTLRQQRDMGLNWSGPPRPIDTLRLTRAMLRRLSSHGLLPRALWDAYQAKDPKDGPGLAYQRLHKSAVALYGINSGSLCPIFIVHVRGHSVYTQLPIGFGFEFGRLLVHGPILLQATRHSLYMYGPRADRRHRLDTPPAFALYHPQPDDECAPTIITVRTTDE